MNVDAASMPQAHRLTRRVDAVFVIDGRLIGKEKAMRVRSAANALMAVLISAGMATVGVVGAPGVASADICPAHVVGAWAGTAGTDVEDGDAGGVSVWARLQQNCFPENYYLAEFRSYGEVLRITDSYADGRVPRVLLEVQGNGTAVFTGSDDHNLDFDEGLDVRIKLCINGTSTCTRWSPYGVT